MMIILLNQIVSWLKLVTNCQDILSKVLKRIFIPLGGIPSQEQLVHPPNVGLAWLGLAWLGLASWLGL
jgi:hypothetical protein